MKVLLLLLVLTVSVFSQEVENTIKTKDKIFQNVSDADLQANIEILHRSFCERSLATLRMRVTYKNTGDKNILLYKYPLGYKDKLKKVDADGKVIFEYPQPIIHPVYVFPDHKKRKKKTEMKIEDYFVILEPGESYEVSNLYQTLPLYIKNVYIKKSDYILEITYPFSSVVREDKMPPDWKNLGIIWNKDMTMLLKFTIEDKDTTLSSNCKETEIKPITLCHINVLGEQACNTLITTGIKK